MYNNLQFEVEFSWTLSYIVPEMDSDSDKGGTFLQWHGHWPRYQVLDATLPFPRYCCCWVLVVMNAL